MSLITAKQLKVLELRRKGITQIEVARILKISQAAVSHFEKSSKARIEGARQTLQENPIRQPLSIVQYAIGNLTDKQRKVLTLRKQGRTQIEVARILKISQAAVSHFEKSARSKVKHATETLAKAKAAGVRK